MKYNWIGAQFGIVAVTLYRTAVMCWLWTCFARNRKQLAIILLVCIGLHTSINTVTILQAVLQCGPNPDRPVNRASYFRYMWEPRDESVVCQSPKVQEYIGYTQGGMWMDDGAC
jgi:hypothetical protein